MGEPIYPYRVELPKDAATGDCTFKGCRFTRGVSQVLHISERVARSAAEGPFTVEKAAPKAEKAEAPKAKPKPKTATEKEE
jgi:hypothetical protein